MHRALKTRAGANPAMSPGANKTPIRRIALNEGHKGKVRRTSPGAARPESGLQGAEGGSVQPPCHTLTEGWVDTRFGLCHVRHGITRHGQSDASV